MGSTMDELAQDQQSIAECIEKVQRRYTQEPIVRRTQVFIQTRLKDLEMYWEDFCQRHEKINSHEMFSEEHPYVKARFFQQVQKIYANVKSSLEGKLEEINMKTTTSGGEDAGNDSNENTNTSSNTKDVGGENMFTDNKESEQLIRIKRQEAQKDSFLRALDRLEQRADQQPSRAYYQQKLNILENYWANITTTHNDIMAHASVSDKVHEYIRNNEYNQLEELFEDTVINLQEKLDSISSTVQIKREDELKLPALKIPHFTGDYREWSSFHDLFQQVIHNNKTLGKTQKMHYLKSHLTGDAAKVIQHLQIIDSNYETAWEMLINRYNNTRLLVNTQIQLLLAQKEMQFESADNLRKLHDTTKECVNALSNLKIDTSTWDPIILYIITQKLDKETHKAYEQSLQNPREIQSLQKFLDFLETKFQALEAFKEKRSKHEHFNSRQNKSFLLATKQSVNADKNKQHTKTINTAKPCKVCKDKTHKIHTCSKFYSMSTIQRRDFAKQNNLCINCLRDDHKTIDCKSIKTCRVCRKKHNTLLHIESPLAVDVAQKQPTSTTHLTTASDQTPSASQSGAWHAQAYTARRSSVNKQVLLATALVNVMTANGISITLRALLDQGSQATLITESAVQRLKVQKHKINMIITGVGNNKIEAARSKVQLTISPRFCSSYKLPITAFVLNKLTSTIPVGKIQSNNWDNIQGLTLADPRFHQPGPIDLILGADSVAEILLQGIIKGKPGFPTAQNTQLGWILFGGVGRDTSVNTITCCIAQTSTDDQLRKFWEIEELPTDKILAEDEKICEQVYETTTSRSLSGKYIVRLPFNPSLNHLELGDSRKIALARQLQLERKFERNKQLEADYKNFMTDYLRLGHMKPVTSDCSEEKFYLPHHSVIKLDSTTTKLRVVFDGSAKTSTGVSLNEKLLTGPSLQQDLFSILLRWRKYKYVIKADIEKMYRQIQIHESDQRYQRILWRSSTNDPIQEFQLTTVTYGTKSAPYLAIKTLQRLADDYRATFPEGSEITRRDFYIDDLMSGAHTMSEALEYQNQLIKLFTKGGFHLRKWSSNSSTLLKTVPEDSKEIGPQEIDKPETESIKTLGIHWYPSRDVFKFKINLPETKTTHATKRTLLSEASRLFDPLGWIAPVTIQAKIMFQELWLEGLTWDQPLPDNINKRWSNFKTELPVLEKVQIPRWIQFQKKIRSCELHGFCDASEKAYAAAVYSRIIDNNKVVNVTLLTAKSKVSPISKKLSLPRLELMGASLLAKLLQEVKKAMCLEETPTYAWTDSTIVLSWIRAHPSKWKTFVANRVSEIHRTTNASQWHHVKSEENPADLSSRGKNPKDLISNKLWWEGPSWLQDSEIFYPENKHTEVDIEVRKVTTTLAISENTNEIKDLISKFSSVGKLKRVLAYCLRFYENSKKPKGQRQNGPPTVSELRRAIRAPIRITQEDNFPEELDRLKKGKDINRNSKLITLNPFLDENGILRVGGRLKHSKFGFNKKHQIILPNKSTLTNLVISEAHNLTLHGGADETLYELEHQYWLANGVNTVKQYTSKCILCFRAQARSRHQQMGNLPKPRVTVSRPFSNCGIDYAGPLGIKTSNLRNAKEIKGYIAVFICLATKAFHLETVTDLTANAFIAAYKRFVGRRGIPENIYSDNATNFVLANKILEKNLKTYKESHEPIILSEVSNMGTTWHFIPPAAPHFGGLWEAGVKSVKGRLKKIFGNTKLTYEELSTALIQIEASLNSRPLCPISTDPNDLEVLTPGHFLIGSALLAPPAPDTTEANISTLTRWQLVERLHQDFWKRWSTEYLTRLQQRPKWASKQINIKKGSIVLLKDEQLPSTKWPLGRIIEVFPGQDGLVRVVSVYTKNGILKRPITRICLLPISDNDNLDTPQPENNNTPQPAATTTNTSKISSVKQDENKVVLKPTPVDSVLNPTTVDYNKLKRTALREAKKQRRRNNPTGKRIRPVVGYTGLISPEGQRMINQKRKNDEAPESIVKIQRKTSCSISKVMAVLLGLMLTPSWANTLQPPVEITQFDHHPGIYFEDLGKIGLMNSEWSIISYFDLTNYWKELLGIRQCVAEIDSLCNITILRRNYCLEILNQLQVQLKQFESVNELLHSRSLSEQHLVKQRRSPMNIVGTVANKLFGILDSDYATHIETELEKTKTNENYLLQLMKNQTSILESTVNIIKKDEDSVKEQFELIIDQVKTLVKQVKSANVQLQEQETTQIFNSLAIHTTLVLQHYGRMQAAIMDAVTDLHHGKINPLIITPRQLRNQLALIQGNIPTTLKVPGNDEEKVIFVYDIMTAKTKVTQTKILFQIKIPLIHNEHYQLLKLIPLPTLHNDSFVYIQPSSDYLIINLHRDVFYPLSQRELENCKGGGQLNYLCVQNHPIYNTKSNFSRCELDLLNHKRTIPPDCSLNTMKPSKLWIQLHSPNTWIYILDQEYTFTVVCGTQVIYKVLNEDGIIKVRADCVLKQDSMIISGHNLYTSHLNSSFLPSINLTNHLHVELPIKRNLSSAPELFIRTNKGELTIPAISEEIKKLKAREELPQKLSPHDIHHYSTTYLILLAIVIAGVYVTCKRCLNWRSRRRITTPDKPIPAPRCPRPITSLSLNDFVLQSTTEGEYVQNTA